MLERFTCTTSNAHIFWNTFITLFALIPYLYHTAPNQYISAPSAPSLPVVTPPAAFPHRVYIRFYLSTFPEPPGYENHYGNYCERNKNRQKPSAQSGRIPFCLLNGPEGQITEG
jgi:hypothetical protein